MKNFLAVLYGIVFGIANVIPGVSGGTMLVVFGCYDKVCGALTLNLKEIKKNIVFLIFSHRQKNILHLFNAEYFNDYFNIIFL